MCQLALIDFIKFLYYRKINECIKLKNYIYFFVRLNVNTKHNRCYKLKIANIFLLKHIYSRYIYIKSHIFCINWYIFLFIIYRKIWYMSDIEHEWWSFLYTRRRQHEHRIYRLQTTIKYINEKRNLCCQIHVKKRYWKGYWFDIYLELKKENSPPYMMYKTQSNILWILPIFRLFFLCTQLGWHLYIIYFTIYLFF